MREIIYRIELAIELDYGDSEPGLGKIESALETSTASEALSEALECNARLGLSAISDPRSREMKDGNSCPNCCDTGRALCACADTGRDFSRKDETCQECQGATEFEFERCECGAGPVINLLIVIPRFSDGQAFLITDDRGSGADVALLTPHGWTSGPLKANILASKPAAPDDSDVWAMLRNLKTPYLVASIKGGLDA